MTIEQNMVIFTQQDISINLSRQTDLPLQVVVFNRAPGRDPHVFSRRHDLAFFYSNQSLLVTGAEVKLLLREF